METLHYLLNFILHLDQHLIIFVNEYGIWTYVLLFAIIFCETGLIILPFLPGDSLLFATGTLAAAQVLNIHFLFILLTIASFLGNNVNYWIGRITGPQIFCKKKSWFFNPAYLEKAHAFYHQYGAKTIIIARFLPIIRTFAPFIAGVGYMNYRQFSLYNFIGTILWIGGLLYLSFLFGNVPIVKENFSLVIMGIIIVSILPALLEFIRRKSFKAR